MHVQVLLANTSLLNNTAADSGGAARLYGNVSLRLQGSSVVAGNAALGGSGGAVSVRSG